MYLLAPSDCSCIWSLHIGLSTLLKRCFSVSVSMHLSIQYIHGTILSSCIADSQVCGGWVRQSGHCLPKASQASPCTPPELHPKQRLTSLSMLSFSESKRSLFLHAVIKVNFVSPAGKSMCSNFFMCFSSTVQYKTMEVSAANTDWSSLISGTRFFPAIFNECFWANKNCISWQDRWETPS